MSVSAVSSSPQVNVCAECGNKDNVVSRCAQCALAYYCNETCQRKHWPMHNPVCKISGEAILQHVPLPRAVGGIVLSCLPLSQVAIPEDLDKAAWKDRSAALKASGGILGQYASALEQQGIEEGEAAKRAYRIANQWVRKFPEECRAVGMHPHSPTFEELVAAAKRVSDLQLFQFCGRLADHGEVWADFGVASRPPVSEKETFAAYARDWLAISALPLTQFYYALQNRIPIPEEVIRFFSVNETGAGVILESVCSRCEPVEPYSVLPPFQKIPVHHFQNALQTACQLGDVENVRGLKTWPQIRNSLLPDLSVLLKEALTAACQHGQLEVLRELQTWPEIQRALRNCRQLGIELEWLFANGWGYHHIINELKQWPVIQEQFSSLFYGVCYINHLGLLKELKTWPQMQTLKVQASEPLLHWAIEEIFSGKDQTMIAEMKDCPFWKELDKDGWLKLVTTAGERRNQTLLDQLKSHPLVPQLSVEEILREVREQNPQPEVLQAVESALAR